MKNRPNTHALSLRVLMILAALVLCLCAPMTAFAEDAPTAGTTLPEAAPAADGAPAAAPASEPAPVEAEVSPPEISVDAGGGSDTVTITAPATGAVEAVGGEGDDTIAVETPAQTDGEVAVDVVIDGGAGSDELSVTAQQDVPMVGGSAEKVHRYIELARMALEA